jgi:hypothetical protein
MDRKEIKRVYLETVQPMGVYKVTNLKNGKLYIDSGLNLKGKMNRCKFQLAHGSHVNKALQADYDMEGPDNFAFGIIDYLKPKKEKDTDYTEDIEMLEELWREKLQPYGDKGYNKRSDKQKRES